MKLTPLKQKIVDALIAAPERRIGYHALAYKLWPPEQHPRSWNYSSNGGPHGWAMPLGRALREMGDAGLTYELRPKGSRGGHGDVVLRRVPNVQIEGLADARPEQGEKA